jgi:acyl carrier protein
MTESVEARIIRIVSRATLAPESAVRPETLLSSIAIGSLEQIECVLAVEEAFRVELDPQELWQSRTVKDLIEAVERARESRPQAPKSPKYGTPGPK